MTRYLVDSDGIIDYLNGFAPAVELLQRLNREGDIPCSCDVVLAEVYAGLHPDEQARAEQLLLALEFLPTSPEAARQAGAWKYRYVRQGTTLAITDCLVAAVAAEHDAVVLTRNTRDYPMPEVRTVSLSHPPPGPRHRGR